MEQKRFILHTADLHIGSGQYRSAEYNLIFDKLLENIEAFSNKNELLILIAGDIFHNKTNYSADDVECFNYLMRSLSKYPVIIIPGNHDCNLNAKDMLDLISPITEQFKNVHYLKNSGLYELYGLKFQHISVFDDSDVSKLEDEFVNGHPDNIEKLKDVILLYHGPINDVKFGSHVVNDSRITRKLISKFKLVLAGDIHQHQFIGPNCAYSGSLIQQNLGESLEKGYIMWDVQHNSSTFNIIENDCGFMRIDVRGKDNIEEYLSNIKMPKKLHKVSFITDAEDEKFNQQCVLVEQKMGRIDKKHCIPSTAKIVNIANDIKDTLSELLYKNKATQEQHDEIIDMHLKNVVGFECKKWNILHLEWENMYKYGIRSRIDFTKLEGSISGIIANNREGKSSVLDILVFVLFNEFLRGDKKSMINKNAKDSYIKVIFIVNDKKYSIERIDDSNYHTKIKLCEIENGAVKNITGKDITETYKKMNKLIGTKSQFLATSLYYDSMLDITKETKSERMRILSEMFGLTDNELIVKNIKLKIKNIKTKIEALIKPRLKGPHVDFTDKQDNLKQKETERQIKQDELNKISLEIAALNLKLDTINKIKTIETEINSINIANKTLSEELNIILPKISTEVVNIDLDAVDQYTEQNKAKLIKLIGLSYPSLCDLDCKKSSDDLKLKIAVLESQINKSITNNGKITKRNTELNKLKVKYGDELASLDGIDNMSKEYPQTGNIDAVKLRDDLNIIDGNLSKIKLFDTRANNKYIQSLVIRIDKLKNDMKLKFNPSCTDCENNKIILASDLTFLETEYKNESDALTITQEQNTVLEELKYKYESQKAQILQNLADYSQYIENMNKRQERIIHSNDLKSKLSVIQNELIENEKIVQIMNEQEVIKKEIQTLTKNLSEITKIENAKSQLNKIEQYEQYLLCDQRNKIVNEINKNTQRIDNIQKKKDDLANSLGTDYLSNDVTKDATSISTSASLSSATSSGSTERGSERNGDESIRENLESVKRVLSADIPLIDKQIGILTSELTQIEEEIKIYDKYNKDFPVLRDEKEKYELYEKCVNTSGLRVEIIKKNIGRVIISANSLLSSMTDFTIQCDIENSDIELYLLEPKRMSSSYSTSSLPLQNQDSGGSNDIGQSIYKIPIALASGFQRFICSIVLRFSLTSMLPSSGSFIFIDEGFGALDKENSSKLIDMFSNIKDLYKFTFIISHLESLQNVIEKPIHILSREFSSTNKCMCSYINNTIDVSNSHTALKEIKDQEVQQSLNNFSNSITSNNEITDIIDNRIKCECGEQVKRKSYRGHLASSRHKKKIETMSHL